MAWQYKEAITQGNTISILLQNEDSIEILNYTNDAPEEEQEQFNQMIKDEIVNWLNHLNNVPEPVDATSLFNPGE